MRSSKLQKLPVANIVTRVGADGLRYELAYSYLKILYDLSKVFLMSCSDASGINMLVVSGKHHQRNSSPSVVYKQRARSNPFARTAGIARSKFIFIVVLVALIFALSNYLLNRQDKAIEKSAVSICYAQQKQSSDVDQCNKMSQDYVKRWGEGLPSAVSQRELNVIDEPEAVTKSPVSAWKIVENDMDGTTSFNMRTYSRKDNIVRIQVEKRFTAPITMRNIPGVMRTLEDDLFDCSQNKIAIVEDSWYSASGELLHSRVSEDADIPALLVSVDLDEYSKKLWQTACLGIK